MAATDRSAVVIGASSGIGEAVARELAAEGYELGLTARRQEKLEELGDELPTKAYVARMDVTEPEAAREAFVDLVEAMNGADLVVVNAGIGRQNRDLDWEPERDTIDTNVRGFTALATAAMTHFEDQGHGHLVGISSVAAHAGDGTIPAYNASKAFVSNYLDGLRYRAHSRDADLTVTTIEPGFVDTKLAGGDFWKASTETAARQIVDAIEDGKRHAYITRRWRLVALAVDLMPDFALKRVFG
ncbi:SDR family NAD(P)-dependent oxidoreductase [Halorientalis salina]|uniref:SDR family NAD(P)-dependent oxidoreductase n=1 Tax=Halorientalis salina TaxID=2932266 RepID=UPI0010AD3535|nr:SDR family NAD(P)-dependent oxidoreductase [Halorientalis salina]